MKSILTFLTVAFFSVVGAAYGGAPVKSTESIELTYQDGMRVH